MIEGSSLLWLLAPHCKVT